MFVGENFLQPSSRPWAGKVYSVTRLDGTAADFRLERQGQLKPAQLPALESRQPRHRRPCGELDAARLAQGAQHAIYIQSGALTDQARRHAQEAGIRLIQRQRSGSADDE